jgi:hypothetical protein
LTCQGTVECDTDQDCQAYLDELVCVGNTLNTYNVYCDVDECKSEEVDSKYCSGGCADLICHDLPVEPECETDADCADNPTYMSCNGNFLAQNESQCENEQCEYQVTGQQFCEAGCEDAQCNPVVIPQECVDDFDCVVEGGSPQCVDNTLITIDNLCVNEKCEFPIVGSEDCPGGCQDLVCHDQPVEPDCVSDADCQADGNFLTCESNFLVKNENLCVDGVCQKQVTKQYCTDGCTGLQCEQLTVPQNCVIAANCLDDNEGLSCIGNALYSVDAQCVAGQCQFSEPDYQDCPGGCEDLVCDLVPPQPDCLTDADCQGLGESQACQNNHLVTMEKQCLAGTCWEMPTNYQFCSAGCADLNCQQLTEPQDCLIDSDCVVPGGNQTCLENSLFTTNGQCVNDECKFNVDDVEFCPGGCDDLVCQDLIVEPECQSNTDCPESMTCKDDYLVLSKEECEQGVCQEVATTPQYCSGGCANLVCLQAPDAPECVTPSDCLVDVVQEICLDDLLLTVNAQCLFDECQYPPPSVESCPGGCADLVCHDLPDAPECNTDADCDADVVTECIDNSLVTMTEKCVLEECQLGLSGAESCPGGCDDLICLDLVVEPECLTDDDCAMNPDKITCFMNELIQTESQCVNEQCQDVSVAEEVCAFGCVNSQCLPGCTSDADCVSDDPCQTGACVFSTAVNTMDCEFNYVGQGGLCEVAGVAGKCFDFTCLLPDCQAQPDNTQCLYNNVEPGKCLDQACRELCDEVGAINPEPQSVCTGEDHSELFEVVCTANGVWEPYSSVELYCSYGCDQPSGKCDCKTSNNCDNMTEFSTCVDAVAQTMGGQCVQGICDYVPLESEVCEFGCEADQATCKPECYTVAECDDDNPFTEDECLDGSCFHGPEIKPCNFNSDCQDADECTDNFCWDGFCEQINACNPGANTECLGLPDEADCEFDLGQTGQCQSEQCCFAEICQPTVNLELSLSVLSPVNTVTEGEDVQVMVVDVLATGGDAEVDNLLLEINTSDQAWAQTLAPQNDTIQYANMGVFGFSPTCWTKLNASKSLAMAGEPVKYFYYSKASCGFPTADLVVEDGVDKTLSIHLDTVGLAAGQSLQVSIVKDQFVWTQLDSGAPPQGPTFVYGLPVMGNVLSVP